MLKSPHSSNLPLAALPAEDMAALVPHLRVIELPHKTVLFEAGDTIKALYFPHNGMVSIVVDLSSGETIEAATIGRDGLVGGSAAIDDDIALNRAIVQIEGMASVVDVGTFRTLVQQSDTLHATLARHRQFILAQAQQSAACQAAHPLTPIGRKDSWCFHAVGSSNAPLLGSTAAEGLPRIGRTSIATRWRSCGLPQSASCSENFVIPPDVFGQTLSRSRPMRTEEGTYLAHRQRDSLLGLLPREHAHFGMRREHRSLHGDRVRVRRDIIRQDQYRCLAITHEIAGHGKNEIGVRAVHLG